jgi:hypothetical protein
VARRAPGEGTFTERHAPRRVEHRRDTVPADHRSGELAEHPSEGADREGEDREEVGDLHDLRRRELAAAHPEGADEEDGEGADGGDGLDGGVEPPARAPHLDVGVAQLVGDGPEALGLVVLAPEGLDDEGGLEALMGHLGDVGAQLLGARDPW